MKQGEVEAKQILKLKGIEFDDNYCDDNSKPNMPDLKYKDGRYLEITHTLHNNNIVKGLNDFDKKTIEEQLKIMNEAKQAYKRIRTTNYSKDSHDNLTADGIKQLKKDNELLKKHHGFDENGFSEFKCDCPLMECSSDKIINAIENKSKKYPYGDTDLFIFILKEEFEIVEYLHNTIKYNGASHSFFNDILKSPFKIIYLCVWDFYSQTYNTDNPTLLKFETISKEELHYSPI